MLPPRQSTILQGMYGLINKAVHGLICERFGTEAWERIRSRAGLPNEPFVAMETYDDAVTFRIVAAATEELSIRSEDIMREFGRFWTLYTAEAGYGELMKSAGKTFPEFVRNLDSLHTRVQLSFPYLQPPSFSVVEETPHSMVVHYYSSRPGLAPLVVGLFEGLGERFSLKLDIEHRAVSASPAHGVFAITWRASPPPSPA